MKNLSIGRLLSGTFLMAAGVIAPVHASTPLPHVAPPARKAPEGLNVRKTEKPSGIPRAVMRAVAPEGKILQGYQGTQVYGVPSGIYRLNTDAEEELLFVDDYTAQGYTLNIGWMREGKLWVTAELSIFDIADYRLLELDPYTGEICSDQEILLADPVTTFNNYLPVIWSSAYDEASDRIYGYGSSENGRGYAFSSAPGNDLNRTECVREVNYREVCVSLAFNPEDGLLYGINRNDDLVSIDPATGNQTVVMATGLSTRYAIAGMLYLPDTKKFLLETLETDDSYCLAEIDLATKTLTRLCYFDQMEQYPFLFLTDAASDPAPIRKPEFDTARFNHSELTGTVSYFLPTEFFAGGEVSGKMTWHAFLNGTECSSGTGMAGDVVSVDMTGLTRGYDTFSLYVEQDGLRSAVCDYTAYVGYDIPNAPEQVTLTESRIEWSPVTRCVNNGYLDRDNLRYHVYLNGEEIGVTQECFYEFSIPDGAPYASYTATVRADNMGQLSDARRSDNIRIGCPWMPGFTIVPTTADASVCSVFDLNQDKDYWNYMDEDDDNPGTGYFVGPRSTNGNANDWLFLPPMQLTDTDVSYEVSFELGNFSSWYPDLEVGVYLHNELDPRKVASVIQEKRAINNTKEYDTYTQRFAISEPGIYYLSFFSDSKPYQGGLRLRNIRLRALDAGTGLPSCVTALDAYGAPKGELKAIVKFDMPLTYVSGEEIPADTEVTATLTLNGNVVAQTGRPGESILVELPSLQGFNHIGITTSIDGAEGQGVFTDVFTGIDVPGPVSSITGYATEDNLAIVASWTAPTESENGYYIDPDDVVYNLMEYGEEGWEVAEVLGKGVFEYTYNIPAGTPLSTVRFGIAPSTVEGVCSTVGWLTDALGTPYDLPVREEFENATFRYSPIRIIRLDDNYVDSEWGVVNPKLIDPAMETASNVACYGRSEGPTQKGMMMLPKFNLEGVEAPGIVFNCWTGAYAADVTVYGETFDSDGFVTLGKFPLNGSGWQEVEMPFPAEFADHKWVAIYIDSYFADNTRYALFSDYEVRGGVSGVQQMEAEGGWIRGGNGEIVMESLAGKRAAVYSLDGGLRWQSGSLSGDRESVKVAAGIYIVKVGESSLKVLVK